ncbi:S1/P1 nuclease [Mucilaginibacter sp. dw_454]|uniref:S1/P1 nuclease n=1 Tax=Mucilaginibacter sp. dw_454 TaxID=2720079 RepID=UPI001BD5A901|nr:S1/P1 nuclease [Mucilaginibacter sp. dw_454]
MKKTFFYALAIGALFLISWGFKGHQAVATIAENHLTPQAKAAVKELLGTQSLSDVATWADEVRNEPAFKSTGGWHFVDLPLGLTFEQFSAEVKGQGEDNVYGAMQKARIILTHPKSTKEQKIEALKFLVHFVGDAHQPMHVSRKEDKGGNTIQVRFDNQGTNLHSLWDSKLIDHQGLTVTEMSKQYDKATPAEIKQWQADQPMQWLWESYQITTKLYAEVEKNNSPDDDYYKTHIGIIEQRIDQGGIRLAGVLNDIYSGKVYSYTFAAPVLPQGEEAKPAAQTGGPAKTIDLKDVANHLNETVTVIAKVYGIKDFSSMILVNVGAAYPDSPLTVVLRGDAKALSTQIDGKAITVTGQVIDYKGKPEIVVTDKSQLSIR